MSKEKNLNIKIIADSKEFNSGINSVKQKANELKKKLLYIRIRRTIGTYKSNFFLSHFWSIFIRSFFDKYKCQY